MKRMTIEVLERAKVKYRLAETPPYFDRMPRDLWKDYWEGRITKDMLDILLYFHHLADWGTGEVRQMSASRIRREVWGRRGKGPSERTICRLLNSMHRIGYILTPQKYNHCENYTIRLTNFVAVVDGLPDGATCILRPTETTGYREEPEPTGGPSDQPFDERMTNLCRTGDERMADRCRTGVASTRVTKSQKYTGVRRVTRLEEEKSLFVSSPASLFRQKELSVKAEAAQTPCGRAAPAPVKCGTSVSPPAAEPPPPKRPAPTKSDWDGRPESWRWDVADSKGTIPAALISRALEYFHDPRSKDSWYRDRWNARMVRANARRMVESVPIIWNGWPAHEGEDFSKVSAGLEAGCENGQPVGEKPPTPPTLDIARLRRDFMDVLKSARANPGVRKRVTAKTLPYAEYIIDLLREMPPNIAFDPAWKPLLPGRDFISHEQVEAYMRDYKGYPRRQEEVRAKEVAEQVPGLRDDKELAEASEAAVAALNRMGGGTGAEAVNTAEDMED